MENGTSGIEVKLKSENFEAKLENYTEKVKNEVKLKQEVKTGIGNETRKNVKWNMKSNKKWDKKKLNFLIVFKFIVCNVTVRSASEQRIHEYDGRV